MSKNPSTDYGSARWATRDDLCERRVGNRTFPSMLKRESERPNPSAWMLGVSPFGRGERIDLPHSTHLIYLGPTRAGKTTLITPNILFSQSSAMVIADPKPELHAQTSGYRPSNILLAPFESKSACWNFIPDCKTDWAFAKLMGISFMEADGGHRSLPYHRNTEAEMIAGSAAHVAHSEYPTMASLFDFMSTGASAWLAEMARSPSREARELAASLQDGKKAAISDMLMNVKTTLGWMKDERIRRFTSASVQPLDWAKIRREHTAVYWSVPLEKQGFLRTLTTAFWNAALYGAQSAKEGGRIKFIFDELGNLGKIQDFAQTVTSVAGLGIDLVMNLQSFSQANAVYGDDDARTIFVNCGKVVLGGLTDVRLLDDLVKLMGTRTVSRERVTETKRGFWGSERSKSRTDVELGVPLMSAEEIAHLPADEQLVLLPGIHPIRQKRFSWTQSGKCAPASGVLGAALSSYQKGEEGSVCVSPSGEEEFPEP